MGEFFIVSAFVGTLFFLLPLYVGVEAHVDVRENKCWFRIGLYRFIKILGGYGQLGKDGIALHITKKKAIFIPYAKMADTRKKFEITQGFQLLRFHQIIETGGAESIYGIMLGAVSNSIAGSVFSILQTKYPFLSLKNNLLLTNKTELKVTLQSEVVFNGLVIAVALTKKLLEALINWIRTKKSTASWKKRRSA
ncbi:MAG: hypothetical protein K2L02_06505 [Clostridia bacterium]|nr:hypothetical protein [Clostridia bacterium]